MYHGISILCFVDFMFYKLEGEISDLLYKLYDSFLGL